MKDLVKSSTLRDERTVDAISAKKNQTKNVIINISKLIDKIIIVKTNDNDLASDLEQKITEAVIRAINSVDEAYQDQPKAAQ